MQPSPFLSQRVVGLKPSGIRKFFDIAATMEDVISLGIGEPDFTTPDTILEAGIRSLRAGETHYTSNAGKIQLREAISQHIEKMYNVSYDAENEILCTVGVSEALYLAMSALLNAGDEVIIVTPCFVAYQAEVTLAGGVPVEVATRFEDNFDLNPAELEKAITERTKAILIGFPNNPTGAVASKESLLEVARLAEKHNLIVISDEIYDQLVYGVKHVCFPALPEMRKRTILLGGFSKDYAMTGWRIGYAAAPADLMVGLARVHQFTIMSAPTSAQDAALVALTDCQEDVDKMVAEYDRRRKLIVSGLNQIGLPTFEPRGAFYAFPKVDVTGLDEDTFANRLLEEEHVAVVPGSAFGLGGDGFVRCSYATHYDKLEDALEKIDRFVNRL